MKRIAFALHRRAQDLFPRSDYLDEAAVRANRRNWIAAVAYLRRSDKLLIDRPVPVDHPLYSSLERNQNRGN